MEKEPGGATHGAGRSSPKNDMEKNGHSKIDLAVVDDHHIFRKGLCLLLESNPRLRVVGECATTGEVIRLCEKTSPDIVLLDLNLPEGDGAEAIPRLSEMTRVIVLTGEKDIRLHQKCLHLGASGLVLKEKASDVLFKAIESVSGGELWFSRRVLGNAILKLTRADEARDTEREKIETLTAREREVIELIGEGYKNREIGERLYISETTVRHHLSSIFSKLGVTSRLELVIYAFRHDLAKVPEAGDRER